MKEIWKDIVGYEGIYQVSDLGNIKRIKYRKSVKEKILKCTPKKDGYLQIDLSKNGDKKRYSVHRLVAIAFISNPYDYPIVNHKDENPTNNRVDNLEWCTYKYNTNYGSCINKISNAKSREVYQYSTDKKLIKKWKSTKECDLNGFNSSNVSRCCIGRRKTYKKCIWSYKPILK